MCLEYTVVCLRLCLGFNLQILKHDFCSTQSYKSCDFPPPSAEFAEMAAAPEPNELLYSTTGKGNFQRVTRLLISGGTTLLRDVFDQICSPINLPKILSNAATEKLLRAAKLTKPQWDCLYPSLGVYGKSADFDVTLLFRLLRTICNLTPPAKGWDALPASTDHSLAADLARIKY